VPVTSPGPDDCGKNARDAGPASVAGCDNAGAPLPIARMAKSTIRVRLLLWQVRLGIARCHSFYWRTERTSDILTRAVPISSTGSVPDMSIPVTRPVKSVAMLSGEPDADVPATEIE
jgi:hypothetical protein